MTVLTEGDKRFLPWALRANKGFHHATKWYFGWTPLPYQWAWHHADVMNTSFVAGIATGKTTIVAASNLIDCLSLPYFRALNTSVTAKQAELPFDMVMSWADDNPNLEHLIEDITLRPFPVITFKNYSEYEFRTAGTDARFIRGSEYDRINFDEGGLDFVGSIPKVLRGRLRGERPNGVTRMARLDVTTSPTAALWLIERFNKGNPGHQSFDPKFYRSLRVATWDNTHLTEMQVEAMKAEYPPDMIDVEMGGFFPDFGISMFAQGHLQACSDQAMYDAAYLALNPEDGGKALPGWTLEEDIRQGIYKYERPREGGRLYIIVGDPGTGVIPKRDSGVVMVADVTEKPYRIVYFDWVSGRGSYNPFLQSYKYAINKYAPVLKGIDATGTQKGMDEVAFENAGIRTEKINFTTEKNTMLNMLVSDISNQEYRYPPIKGLLSQMGVYTLEHDRKGGAQDIVMSMAMLSYLARFIPANVSEDTEAKPANYRKRKHRTNVRAKRA